MAKVTPIAQVRTILDAEDAASASAGVLALLDGETLEPGTLTLPDFEDSTPPINALGLAGGRLSLGDGSTVAGNPLTPRRVAGMKVCNLNGTNKTSARFAVVGIPLTAAEVVSGAAIQISGTVKLIFGDDFYISEDPILSATIGLTHTEYKTDVSSKWQKFQIIPTSAGETVYLSTAHLGLNTELSANAIAGSDKVVIGDSGSMLLLERWGGVSGQTFSASSVHNVTPISDTSVAVAENIASSLWLCVEIVMGASGTNGSINFSSLYDLTIDVVLP